jgi:hypothetical protein
MDSEELRLFHLKRLEVYQWIESFGYKELRGKEEEVARDYWLKKELQHLEDIK